MKNITIKQSLFLVTISIVIATVFNIAYSFHKTEIVDEKIKEKRYEILPHIFRFLELQKDVIQVQQWLTDVSATRAKPGFDDGYNEAKKYFDKANAVLDVLIGEHKKYNEPQVVQDLESFKKDFASYYDIGVNMANAYVKGGPDLGNPMMEKLDPFAEKLTVALDKWIKEHKIENALGADVIESSITQLERMMLVNGILLVLFTLTILYIIANRIVSSLYSFQEGLLSFFKYLHREIDEVHFISYDNKDEIGVMARVVNDNIKFAKEHVDEDRKLIDETIEVLAEFEQGDFHKKVTMKSTNESLNQLTILLNKMGDHLKENIEETLKILEEYSNNDFRKKVSNNGLKKHLLELANGINTLGDAITRMLIDNINNAVTMQSNSQNLLSNVDVLNRSSNEAAVSLEQTAAALEEITATITSNTQNVSQMSTYAKYLNQSAVNGKELANQTTTSMDEINQQVQSINEAISVIDQIAFQTNILSLNAAVEAATAGEAGKGFAVVAGEVRNLASRSAEAAHEIKQLVLNATTKANDGKIIADKMIDGYNELNENIDKTSKLIADVESSSKEQQQSIVQINDTVATLDTQTQQNASIASQVATIAQTTETLAEVIVKDVQEKEFNGKENIKTASKEIVKKIIKDEKIKSETVVKPQVKQETKKLETIVENKKEDDDWESF